MVPAPAARAGPTWMTWSRSSPARGGRPARDARGGEFAGRLQAGGEPDVEEFAGEPPEYTDRLRKLLPAMRALADLGRSADPVKAGVAPPVVFPDSPPATLGEF